MKGLGAVLVLWAAATFGWFTVIRPIDGGLCAGHPLRVAAFGYTSPDDLSKACRHDAVVAVGEAAFPVAGLLLGGIVLLVEDEDNEARLRYLTLPEVRSRLQDPPPPPRP